MANIFVFSLKEPKDSVMAASRIRKKARLNTVRPISGILLSSILSLLIISINGRLTSDFPNVDKIGYSYVKMLIFSASIIKPDTVAGEV